jgi:hypothetical protein
LEVVTEEYSTYSPPETDERKCKISSVVRISPTKGLLTKVFQSDVNFTWKYWAVSIGILVMKLPKLESTKSL